jgi:tyrosine-protein phosphatase SIW14
MFRPLILILLLPALVPAAPANTINNIPRFQKVAEGLYRGGQPDRAGFDFLKQQGVQTVVNFKEENDEEAIVRALGMNYIHIPMRVTVWSRISDASIRRYFEIFNNPANFPVFVHCERGADRTGAMVGFYRIAVQGWDGTRAFKEAREIGMRWWYAGLKQQLYNFKPTPVIAVTTAVRVP